MASAVRQYTDEVHEAFSYWATWLPNATIRAGDCGPVKDRVFKPETALEDFGVAFEVTRGQKPLDLQHASQGSVTYKLQLAAGNQTIPEVPQGTAGIEISFGRENSVVLVVREGHEHRIKNIRAMGRQLLDLAASGDFPRDYAVVTHVVVAQSATILISSARNSRFAASAEAELKAGLLELANAEVGFSRVSGDSLQTEILAVKGLTPLFKLVGFKKDGWFWGSQRVVDLGYEDDASPGDLSEVEPGDTDPEE